MSSDTTARLIVQVRFYQIIIQKVKIMIKDDLKCVYYIYSKRCHFCNKGDNLKCFNTVFFMIYILKGTIYFLFT